MGYLLDEESGDGTSKVLGEPIFDLVVARVIAARRASRLRRPVSVRDEQSGAVVARFDGTAFVPAKSGQRMRAVDPGEGITDTLTRRKIS